MPVRAPVLCACGRVKAVGQQCSACRPVRATRKPDTRPSASRRGYNVEWRKARAEFLAEHPYCACGCGRKADVVDHVIPHRGNDALFWDRSNWQALAASPCHNSLKQAQERRR